MGTVHFIFIMHFRSDSAFDTPENEITNLLSAIWPASEQTQHDICRSVSLRPSRALWSKTSAVLEATLLHASGRFSKRVVAGFICPSFWCHDATQSPKEKVNYIHCCCKFLFQTGFQNPLSPFVLFINLNVLVLLQQGPSQEKQLNISIWGKSLWDLYPPSGKSLAEPKQMPFEGSNMSSTAIFWCTGGFLAITPPFRNVLYKQGGEEAHC